MQNKYSPQSRKNWIILIVFLLGSSYMIGQLNADSLKQVWNDTAQKRQDRFQAIYQLSKFIYMQKSPDTAFYYAELHREFAAQNNLPNEEALALNNLGNALVEKGDHSEALTFLNKSYLIIERIDNERLEATNHMLKGRVYRHFFDFENALDHFQKYLDISEILKDSISMSSAINSIGNLFTLMGDHDQALEYYNRSVQMLSKNDDRAMIHKYLNIAGIYSKKGMFETAYQYRNKAFELSEKMNYTLGLSISFYMKAFIEKDQKNWRNAIVNYKESLILQEKMGRKRGIIGSLISIGQMHNNLEEYDKSIQHCERALIIAEEDNNINQLNFICNCLYTAYKGKGEGDKALTFFERAIAYKDSMRIDENAKLISQKEFKYKFEKQKAIDDLRYEASLKNRNNWLFFLLSLFMGICGVAYIQYKGRIEKQKLVEEVQKKNEEVTQMNQQIIQTKDQLVEQEKMAFLGQLTAGIGHEIKNPLNFITNFSEGSKELLEELEEEVASEKTNLSKGKIENINDLINDLKLNMTDILDNGLRMDSIVNSMMDHTRGIQPNSQATDLNDLISKNMELAYHGFKASYPTFNIKIIKEFDDEIGLRNVFSQEIGRVILNLFNNSCFALAEKNEVTDFQPMVKVNTLLKDEDIIVKVWDNGIGIPEKNQAKIFTPFFTTKPTGHGNTGLGLSISHDIIVQLHKGSLDVESEPEKFTEFTIIIPS